MLATNVTNRKSAKRRRNEFIREYPRKKEIEETIRRQMNEREWRLKRGSCSSTYSELQSEKNP